MYMDMKNIQAISTEDRPRILQLCELYLEKTPEHRFGVCHWFDGRMSGGYGRYNAYRIIGSFRLIHEGVKEEDLPSYIGTAFGYNEARANLVADLRAFLLADND